MVSAWRGSLVGLALVALGLTVFVNSGARPGVSAGAARETAAPAPPSLPAVTEREALEAYGKLPLAFVPNEGQTDARVRYSAHAGGASFYFTQTEAVFAFSKRKRGSVLRLAFLGANPRPKIEGQRLGSGKVNYLLGSDPAKWHTNLPTYGQVVYRDLWPGVDMIFRGAAGRLKYEFVLGPGARVADIRLAYRGARKLSVSPAGALLIGTPLGLLRDERPRSHQLRQGKRVPVASRYVLRGVTRYGFAVARGYDRARPLVIDPGLAYSTFLGGTAFDLGSGIAVDRAGRAYVTGETDSADFPTTARAHDQGFNGGFGDAFVTKLNAAGTALVYSTYLGGTAGDQGFGIAVGGAGRAYVTGVTGSADFPTTAGAHDPGFNGGFGDAFITKLNAAGSALVYSTYLGGREFDRGSGIAVGGAGRAYVTGGTGSADFPTTAGANDQSLGAFDAFVTKLNAAGSALVYSTFLGGTAFDEGLGIAVGGAGRAYVTGATDSADFAATAGAHDRSLDGFSDAFVTKLNAAGSALVYSTYVGGTAGERGFGIAVGGAGRAYVTGVTDSADFPTTVSAHDQGFNGGFGDAFVTKLNVAGSALVYSTFLGGTAFDQGLGIAVGRAGRAYVTGLTDSADFPATAGAHDQGFNGAGDAFVTKLNAAGSTLVYSTFLGGTAFDLGSGIAVGGAGRAYVTGFTISADFPTTAGAHDQGLGGFRDAFVTKLDPRRRPSAEPG